MNGVINNAIWYQVTLVPMVSHDQKSHITPYCDCLDLGNAMVSLIMPSASCDADTSTSYIT